MFITGINIKNFRNLKDISINPEKNVNIFIGENAQGKTNLIEAIYLFSGENSFRRANNKDFINFNENFAKLEIDFFAKNRQQTASIEITDKKIYEVNGNKLKSKADISKSINFVVFSPTHLSLIKDHKGLRRDFLDDCIIALKPHYYAVLRDYERIIRERNTILQTSQNIGYAGDFLSIYDDLYAKYSELIFIQRRKFLDKLSPVAKSIYSEITENKEEFDISYISSVDSDEDYKNRIVSLSKQALNDEFTLKSTKYGPHKDDFEIKINGLDLRIYGSQGQQRSAVLALKFAFANLLEDRYEEKPIILLDDVLSELDYKRQNYLINKTQGYQTFITCCDADIVDKIKNGKVFHVKQGEIE